MIDLILEKQPNLRATDKKGRDPICLAVELSNIDLYNKLNDSDEIDIHRTYYENEQNLLHIACQNVCYPVVMSLLDDHGFLPDAHDLNDSTPLHYAVAYKVEKKIKDEEEEEEEIEEGNKMKIISELIYRGCDPSQINKLGRCPFTLSDQKTMETIGKAMEDPRYSINLEERRQYWKDLQEKEVKERYETKKLAMSNNNYAGNRSIMKLSKKERAKRREQLSIMTARGGTLRNVSLENSKIVPKPSEIRPWGGSKETYIFQREIRSSLRIMNKYLRDQLDQMYSQVIELKNIVAESENNYNSDDTKEGNEQPDNEVINENGNYINYDDNDTQNE